jgi:DNA gyrase subunit A
MLFFTDRGRVYGQRVFNLPESARDGRGLPMVNILNLAPDERVTAILVVPDFEQAEYVTLLTRRGKIKRVQLSEFNDVRPSGIIAMNLGPGDELRWARLTAGKDDFLIVTAGGKACRFTEHAVRAMGRSAAGVMAIRLAEEDCIAAFDVVEPNGELLVVSEHGFGKRSPMSEFPVHGRNSQGVWALDHNRIDETGRVAAARVVHIDDQVTIITSNGIVIRTVVRDIRQTGRASKGVRVVTPGDGDTVTAMARLSAAVEARAYAEAQAEAARSVTREVVRPTNGDGPVAVEELAE